MNSLVLLFAALTIASQKLIKNVLELPPVNASAPSAPPPPPVPPVASPQSTSVKPKAPKNSPTTTTPASGKPLNPIEIKQLSKQIENLQTDIFDDSAIMRNTLTEIDGINDEKKLEVLKKDLNKRLKHYTTYDELKKKDFDGKKELLESIDSKKSEIQELIRAIDNKIVILEAPAESTARSDNGIPAPPPPPPVAPPFPPLIPGKPITPTDKPIEVLNPDNKPKKNKPESPKMPVIDPGSITLKRKTVPTKPSQWGPDMTFSQFTVTLDDLAQNFDGTPDKKEQAKKLLAYLAESTSRNPDNVQELKELYTKMSKKFN